MIDAKVLARERRAVKKEGLYYQGWEHRRAAAETVDIVNVVSECIRENDTGRKLSSRLQTNLTYVKWAAVGNDGFWFCTACSKTACIRLARAIGLKVRS